MYQIFQSWTRKTIEFTPHDVTIKDLHNPNIIVATKSIDPTSWLYHFDGFESPAPFDSSSIAHVESLSKF